MESLLALIDLFITTVKTVSLDPKTNIKVPDDRYGLHAIDVLDPDTVIGREGACCYHDMIVEMIKWGFQDGKTLFGFGYDFQQSNRFHETLVGLEAKLESIHNASGGKKINIIVTPWGLLVKFFTCIHSDIFEKYVKSWIAIAAHFKLIERPSIYELMACPDFDWQHLPALEIWRKKQDKEDCHIVLESYNPSESIDIFKEVLSDNSADYNGETMEVSKCQSDLQELQLCLPTYVCVDGDETVPVESAKRQEVGVLGEHRGVLCDHHVFHYVILAITFEMERNQEKGVTLTSLKEEWEIINSNSDRNEIDRKPCVSNICLYDQ
ncbi:hypothetical protein SAY87_000422 [Trapa incisa]|uniref:Uncharacterized protein n=1 Tax=Trapa incisa TaxID=236973 RepID=A0AAN7GC15_9MYRT|nr:hypothetical protein SAY87_000422 [Trapa incisa]